MTPAGAELVRKARRVVKQSVAAHFARHLNDAETAAVRDPRWKRRDLQPCVGDSSSRLLVRADQGGQLDEAFSRHSALGQPGSSASDGS